MSQGTQIKQLQKHIKGVRAASSHVVPGAAAPPKPSMRLTSGDLYHLEGSASGPQGMEKLKEKNDAKHAAWEAKQGREQAKMQKLTDGTCDGKDAWLEASGRAENGDPDVLESLKVPQLKSILMYLTQEQYNGKKQELQGHLRARTKWKDAMAKGAAARGRREAAAAAEEARVAAGGAPEVAADADVAAAGAGAGNVAGAHAAPAGAGPGRGRGGRGLSWGNLEGEGVRAVGVGAGWGGAGGAGGGPGASQGLRRGTGRTTPMWTP